MQGGAGHGASQTPACVMNGISDKMWDMLWPQFEGREQEV
jgi:hypothetical protein